MLKFSKNIRTLLLWICFILVTPLFFGCTSINQLIEFQRARELIGQERYYEAEPYAKKLIDLTRHTRLQSPLLSTEAMNLLALIYANQGKLARAEELYKDSLAIRQRKWPNENEQVSDSLTNLGLLYTNFGKYEEAERLLNEALRIRDKILSSNHPKIGAAFNNLGNFYFKIGLMVKAERYYSRSIEILENATDNEAAITAPLNNLADIYRNTGRAGKALELSNRVLIILNANPSENDLKIASTLDDLGGHYFKLGDYAKAEFHVKRALIKVEQNYGSDAPYVAFLLGHLAEIRRLQNQYSEALDLYNRSIIINKRSYGEDHFVTANNYHNLSLLYKTNGKYKKALEFARKSTQPFRCCSDSPNQKNLQFFASKRRDLEDFFINQVDILYLFMDSKDSILQDPTLMDESFKVSQLAHHSEAAKALTRMAARFAVGDVGLSKMVREHQDAVRRYRHLEERLSDEISKNPAERNQDEETYLRNDLKEITERVEKLNKELENHFPEYIELVSREPLSLKSTKKLLAPDEALLCYLVTKEATFLWVIRRDNAIVKRIGVPHDHFSQRIMKLRAGLDLQGNQGIPIYNLKEASQLHEDLVSPAAPLLEGINHILLVPDSPLESLPFGILIKDEPNFEVDESQDIRDFRTASWMSRDYSISVFPSVSSLKSLRRVVKPSKASHDFIGFGNPLLMGKSHSPLNYSVDQLFTPSGVANGEIIRQFPALPDTAKEVNDIAIALNADPDKIFLQERATELQVKTSDLSDYRVIAFATHGLIAGELMGLAEPALVLTPPAEGSKEDDGLLTASEVAQLELNADLVILSACNTAAADGSPGAEGFSGLARAFLYAGARSVLVSHWYVSSDATTRLTTKIFRLKAQNPSLTYTQALKQSMAWLSDSTLPRYAHPSYWGPFSIVGGIPHQLETYAEN